ncbi:Uncharacterised protein [Algoriella xinjiangensis]|uniref:hypothetical protein n=1 Tax=Algoriella xinjiangensis TaxID=684065 RepID=UPI000F63D75A|nr:hypothetical protein [Algoriella xinjiangensis]VDH16846.1 Uncharacterised protein [Algoriella xinjiangensis]
MAFIKLKLKDISYENEPFEEIINTDFILGLKKEEFKCCISIFSNGVKKEPVLYEIVDDTFRDIEDLLNTKSVLRLLKFDRFFDMSKMNHPRNYGFRIEFINKINGREHAEYVDWKEMKSETLEKLNNTEFYSLEELRWFLKTIQK